MAATATSGVRMRATQVSKSSSIRQTGDTVTSKPAASHSAAHCVGE